MTNKKNEEWGRNRWRVREATPYKASILIKQFNSRYGINNWCLYNQEDQDRTSLIVRGESGFYNTTYSFSDDYVDEIHKENGISDEVVTEIICSSMFNLGSA